MFHRDSRRDAVASAEVWNVRARSRVQGSARATQIRITTTMRIQPENMLALIAMAQLIVRDIPQEVVVRLKQRAAKRGHSAEAEHREILRQALLVPAAASLKAMLNDIPDVGRDSDFARPRRIGRRVAL